MNLTREDSGKYICKIWLGEVLSETNSVLEVTNSIIEYSGPTFQPKPQDSIEGIEGNDMLLACHARDRSPDTSTVEISWIKDNVKLKIDENREILGNGNLLLKKSTYSDRGVYSCKAKNKNDEIVAKISLEIFRKY